MECLQIMNNYCRQIIYFSKDLYRDLDNYQRINTDGYKATFIKSKKLELNNNYLFE